MVPGIVPDPPVILAPPRTTAAIQASSNSNPALPLAVNILDV